MRVEVVPAEYEHVEYLAHNLRQQDVDEVKASSGLTPYEALLSSFSYSDHDLRWTGLLDDTPLCMFGAAPLIQGSVESGAVWLLGTPRMHEYKVQVWKYSTEYIRVMHGRYRILTNFIDYRNVRSLRWLTRLGFHPIHADPEFGHGRCLFIQYASFRELSPCVKSLQS